MGAHHIAGRRPDHVQEPGDVIVDEGDELRDEAIPNEALADRLPSDQLFQEEEMPLLVILLESAAAGEIRERMGLSDRDKRQVLPGLVRDAGDHLQHLELAERPLPTVEEIHCRE
jgi:hypothetical protein